jgi:hypothetical protein
MTLYRSILDMVGKGMGHKVTKGTENEETTALCLCAFVENPR